MFKRRTLFVVGAGASVEYGFPTGPTLASRISDRLDIKLGRWDDEYQSGDLDLFSKIVRRWPKEDQLFHRAALKIRNGVRLSSSIDDFLDVHVNDKYVQRVGKAAIVKTILEYERESSLFVSRKNAYNKMKLHDIDGTWLIKLMRVLSRGVQPDRLDEIFDNIAFISFNYDRCIEHFFFNAIQLQYSVDSRQAAAVVQKLDIIHPYGTVGALPMDVQHGIHFGGDYDKVDEDYGTLSESIRTYTEQIEDSVELELIRSQVQRASQIVFLGFAFHDQNMALLKPSKLMKEKPIYGTAFGMSENDVAVVTRQLHSFFERRGPMSVYLPLNISAQHKCESLFDFYGKSLPA